MKKVFFPATLLLGCLAIFSSQAQDARALRKMEVHADVHCYLTGMFSLIR